MFRSWWSNYLLWLEFATIYFCPCSSNYIFIFIKLLILFTGFSNQLLKLVNDQQLKRHGFSLFITVEYVI
jgi:hypothetical protein